MESLGRINRKLQVRQDIDEIGLRNGVSSWVINRDTVPLPASRRTWGSWSFVGYWCLTGINISTWSQASALLALGLNVWQAMICIIVGEIFVAAACIGNGFVGAEWHIGFPIYSRFVFGVFGALLPLIMRIILSFIWYSVQLYFGGKCVGVCIGAIWPSFYNMRNTLPASAGIETNDFISLIVFYVISLPLIWVPPEHYRKPFMYGSVAIVIASFTLLIWALAKEGGAGALVTNPAPFLQTVPLTNSEIGWAMVYGIIVTIGSISSGILNQSDYTRFAAYPRAQIWSQALVVPLSVSITSVIGVLVTSCAASFYPDQPLLWAPYDLLKAIQLESGTHGARAAVFFAGFAFCIAQLGLNIPGNAIAGGIDLSGLFPKYINIRRGAYFTALIGIACCPWYLLSKALTFLTVLSSFSVFLGPLTGIMICDYLFIRKRHIKLTDLYRPNSSSIYWYTYGINWRPYVAFPLGFAFLLPGFIASVNTSVSVDIAWTHVYQLAWPLGFLISGGVHVALSKIFPPEGLGIEDVDDQFQTFADGTGTGRNYLPNNRRKPGGIDSAVEHAFADKPMYKDDSSY